MTAPLQLLFIEGAPEQCWFARAEEALRTVLTGVELRLARAPASPIAQLMNGATGDLQILREQRWDLVLLPLSAELDAGAQALPPAIPPACPPAIPIDARESYFLQLIQELRARETKVALANLFRHVPRAHPRKRELREEIRALNLMARRLSHQTHCFVFDIDRELAHDGALQLGADCFGGGARAGEVAIAELKILAMEMLGEKNPEARA